MSMPPALEIHLVSESEEPQLWRELQVYLAELSWLGATPRAYEFPYRYFDLYWHGPDRWPFWINWQGQRAGFALVRKDEAGVFDMAEFYIRPEHRRTGIGTGSARALFARFSGRWHVSELIENSAAIAFWRRVFDGFVPYNETANSQHVEQTFEIRRSEGA